MTTLSGRIPSQTVQGRDQFAGHADGACFLVQYAARRPKLNAHSCYCLTRLIFLELFKVLCRELGLLHDFACLSLHWF